MGTVVEMGLCPSGRPGQQIAPRMSLTYNNTNFLSWLSKSFPNFESLFATGSKREKQLETAELLLLSAYEIHHGSEPCKKFIEQILIMSSWG